MKIDSKLTPADLKKAVTHVFELSAKKVLQLDKSWDTAKGTPVFTVDGKYASRGWTEWTQGFQYGCAILCFDALEDEALLELGRARTLDLMAPHVSHVGVHDHGFNNLSTYGNLRRLMREGKIEANEWELAFYDMAIKSSGAVQAARWSDAPGSSAAEDTTYGYVYSFNGPHSLFIDTMRTIRIMGVAHQLGHVLMGENDRKINLLQRLITHSLTSARFNIFYGKGRDSYDIEIDRGRTVHEAVFNKNDGRFRCPSSQQGYSPFTTWTRGLAWSVLGFAEELEFLDSLDKKEFDEAGVGSKKDVLKGFLKAARANADFYISRAGAKDGICYWDTGAPGLAHMGDYLSKNADPYNKFEPVDSSASAIAAQGLLRLGKYIGGKEGDNYFQAGLTIAQTLCGEPYLSTNPKHQGILLHSVYHRPNGWDFIPKGQSVPCGESSMWGDYHMLELCNLIKRLADQDEYPTFFDQEV
jgi:unsaturated chondroitin disaccharide hydrolase